MIRVEYFTGRKRLGRKQAYARIIAANGEPLFVTEGHANRADVIDTVQTTIASIQRDGVVEEFDPSWRTDGTP